ncbi:hypothetical protein QJS10_CPB14g01495 [Acorus calamus]|uniref:Uncharacterized protein n=1 Tax=Acorus calamus TaxID=4465 RepID=A0AAV9DAI9_ACOCL|nr:hypothetical protein QJS10_CPB14g01495 [Acorus calamus]
MHVSFFLELTGIILSRDDDGITAASGNGDHLRFYDVLADHYVRVPDDGKRILDLIVQIWSQSFASHIFVLLFHKWLFEVPIDSSEGLLRYGSALVQGASNVFWIDAQSNTRGFFSLFFYLLEEVALVPSRLDRTPVQARRELYLLLSSRPICYRAYGSATEIKSGASTDTLPIQHENPPRIGVEDDNKYTIEGMPL